MTDDADEWMTTREAAEALGMSMSFALPTLIQTGVGRLRVNARLSKWRRVDVHALAELRRDGEARTRTRDRGPNRTAHYWADRVRQFWADRGYEVAVEVVRTAFGLSITSDTLNGLPRDWTGSRK